jgi:hypothetical protein
VADEETKPALVAVAFFKSRIMQGLLTVFVSMTINIITHKYKVDFSLWGTSIPDIVQGITYVLCYAGLVWAGHARVASSVPIPSKVTFTTQEAKDLNIEAGATPPDPKS